MDKKPNMKALIILKWFRRPLWWFCRKWLIDCNHGYSKLHNHLFTESCKYEFDDLDKYDWNKLWGISTKLNPHHDSCRIVWRWNKDKQKIELTAYCYVSGYREIASTIVDMPLNKFFFSEIVYDKIENTITISIENKILYKVIVTKDIQFMYRCGLYFGGNKRAPHSMKILEL